MKYTDKFNILSIGMVMLITSGCGNTPQPEPAETSTETERTVLFLCPHSAAKSVLAAAYFEKLAAEEGLDFKVSSAGTDPDPATSPAIVELLKSEGIDVSGHTPRRVTKEELDTAYRVISLGCDVSEMIASDTTIEHWDEVTSPSEGLRKSRDMIYERVVGLVASLKQGG